MARIEGTPLAALLANAAGDLFGTTCAAPGAGRVFELTDTGFATGAAPCFAAGTRISTERGEIAVEAIRAGDLVRVLLEDGLAPVVRAGRPEVDCTRHPMPEQVWPVRIAAGAFRPGRPHSESFLSPDHAVYVEDVLIPVKLLINGSTIEQVPVDRITYHHIELPQHGVVLAQGLPAESYLDMKDGSKQANRPEPIPLYPDFYARMWEAFGRASSPAGPGGCAHFDRTLRPASCDGLSTPPVSRAPVSAPMRGAPHRIDPATDDRYRPLPKGVRFAF